MNFKRSIIVAALAGLATCVWTGNAAAYVYAGSSLNVENLEVSAFPSDGEFVEPVITGYTFTTTATSELNNTGEVTQTLDCNQDTCSNTAPVLTSISNGMGGTQTREDDANLFSFIGPTGTDTYANSASQIGESELATGNPTTSGQISEVEIEETGIGTASTFVESTTTFNFVFTIPGTDPDFTTASILVTFDADPNLFVAIDSPDAISFASSASTTAQFNLTGDAAEVTWLPNASGNVQQCLGVTCVATGVEDLNQNLQLLATNPDERARSDDRTTGGINTSDEGFQSYSIVISGLVAGDYTLGLTARTSARAEQVVAVPEPSIMALLGLGLLGLGFAMRRKGLV